MGAYLGLILGVAVGVHGVGESLFHGVSGLMEKLSTQVDWGKSGGNAMKLSLSSTEDWLP